MNLTLRIPNEIAWRLGETSADLERQALEAFVVESFRAGRMNEDELAQMLGLDGSDQMDGFLKAHDVFEPCTVDDIDRDLAPLAELDG